MNRICTSLFSLTLLLALTIASAQAASPSTLDQALDGWAGQRQVLLRSDLDDPLASSLVQDLLADLLRRGFTVTPAARDAEAESGLVIDLRSAGEATIVVLSRGQDGAIIALEKSGGEKSAAADEQKADRSAVPETTKPKSVNESPAACLPPGLTRIADHPRALALLASDDDQCEVLLLHDDELVLHRASGSTLERLTGFPAPTRPSRALYLGAGDIDDDGSREIAVVWAEDVQSIYEGVDSRIHSWILRFGKEGLQPASPDLEAHLRIVDDTAYLQHRGEHAPFDGPVFGLVQEGNSFRKGAPVAWPTEAGLYATTPLNGDLALGLTDDHRPEFIPLSGGADAAHTYLAETLGAFKGPEVATRRAEAEYRLGLEKEGQVLTDYHPLPRPVAISANGHVYTVRRGRQQGLPLISDPTGKDAIVRIAFEATGPKMISSFPGISSFIVDFALIENEDTVSALLLVNEEPDGDGAAYLTLLRSPPK